MNSKPPKKGCPLLREHCNRPDTLLLSVHSGKSGHKLEQVTEDRAVKCLQRIDVLSAVREEILPHPNFAELIKLCEASFEVPHWWQPMVHDRDLLKGVAR